MSRQGSSLDWEWPVNPPHRDRTATAQQNAKGRRPTSPVLLPFPTRDKGAMVLHGGGFYPQGARHNGFLCEPGGRAAICPALALCIRRRYVTNRHNGQRSATRPRTVARARNCPAATALAACEPQGLDGVAVGLSVAMKPAVVKRRRKRSGTNAAREASRWRVYAFGALSGCYGVAMARGLRVLLQAP